MNTNKDNLATQVEEKAPDSGKPILTTPAAVDQLQQSQALTAHIQAKMTAGETLTDAEKSHMDGLANAIENDLTALRSGKLTLAEMMSRMANISGIGFSSVAPTSGIVDEQTVEIPRNSDVSGITEVAKMVDDNAKTEEPVAEPAPVVAEIQHSVTVAIDEPPASEVERRKMESRDTLLAQPAQMVVVEPLAVQPAPVEVAQTSSTATEAPVAPKISSRPTTGRPSKHPNSQLTMSPDGNFFPINMPAEAPVATGDAELDSEFSQFQNSTVRSENVAVLDAKVRIKDVLDNLEIAAIRDREEEVMAARKAGSSKLANLGKMFTGALASLESIVYPKAELYRNMKKQKEGDLNEARASLERDIQSIRTGIGAIGEYVDRSFGISFHFDTTDSQQLRNFFDNCENNPNSPHYQAVRRIALEQVNARLDQYNSQVDKIQSDPSYDQNLKELLYGSPALAATTTTPETEATKGSWYLRMKEKIGGLFKGKDKSNERPELLNKRIAIPVIASAITFNAVSQRAKLVDPQNLDPREEQTNVVNIAALQAQQAERKSKERKRKGGIILAAAAALGIAGLAGFGVYKTTKDSLNKNESGEVAKGPKTTPTSTPSAVSTAPVKVAAITDVPKESENIEPVKPAPSVADEKGEKVQKPAIQAKSTKAKTYINTGKVPSVDKPEPKKTDNPEVKADDKVELSMAEKNAAATKAEGKVSAYKRKVDLILGKDFKAAPADENHLIGLIGQVTDQMKTLRTKADLKKLDNTYAAIEADFNKLEQQRNVLMAPKYVANAEVDSKIALGKLQVIKGLMANKGNKFTIHHTVRQTTDGRSESTIAVPYSVDLDQIEAKLNQIAKRNSVSLTPNVSEGQAKMDAADAHYWVGYLNFVDWYARYRLNGVDVTFNG